MKNYLIAILLTGLSSIKAMEISPKSIYLTANKAMVDRALKLVYQKHSQITEEAEATKITYSLPPISNSIGILVGPEVSVSYYPGSKIYLASMVRKSQDKHGKKYTEHYGFTNEQGSQIFEVFDNLKNPQPKEIETEEYEPEVETKE